MSCGTGIASVAVGAVGCWQKVLKKVKQSKEKEKQHTSLFLQLSTGGSPNVEAPLKLVELAGSCFKAGDAMDEGFNIASSTNESCKSSVQSSSEEKCTDEIQFGAS